MASKVPFASACLTLTRNRWLILAGDAEAARVVAALGEAMSLLPESCPTKKEAAEQWSVVRVFVDPGLRRPTTDCYGSGTVLCLLPPPENNDMLVIGMSFIAQAIAHAEMSRGGLLVHGALATSDQPGCGIILAGPGTVGKTTASNRLPLPWRSLSDDASLMVRDDRGQYLAHPWPTWSRFFSTPDGNLGPGGRWNVQASLPLQAIFFLAQAEEVRIAPLPLTEAVTYLMDTVQHVTLPMTWSLPIDQLQVLHANQLVAAEEFIRTIPAYTLHLNLTGPFWNNIEEILASNANASTRLPYNVPDLLTEPKHIKYTSPSVLSDDGILTVSFSGPSMLPTLRHPDILEVVPYADHPPRLGDIVYFHSPADNQKVIHRVIRITANGISTRGDNNSADDPYFLQPKDIIGRVSAAWRHGRRRKISGGFSGTCTGYSALLRRQTGKYFSPLLHGIFQGLAANSFLRLVLPSSYRPRVFEFKQRHLPSILKLIVNEQVIGQYDAWKKLWEIDRSWRMIIDVSELPVVVWAPSMDAPDLEYAASNSTSTE